MKYCLQLYHFLGGVYFALVLIGSVALFVIAGTFLESFSQSHGYASQYIYSNPIFALLLWGFFVNILFSATRRWPFKVKHIPFLTTHFGMLMILGGTLIKHYFGVQGSMSILEGSGSQEIFESNTFAIHVEGYNVRKTERYELKKTLLGFKKDIGRTEDGLRLSLAEFNPHSTERLTSWVKGNHASILGLDPMPMHQYTDGPIPISGKVRFFEKDIPWDLYAIRTANLNSVIEHLYLNRSKLRITDRYSKKLIREIPLKDLNQENTSSSLSLSYSSVKGFDSPHLQVTLDNIHKISIPLNGLSALLNLNESTPYLGSLPIAVDIIQQPLLAIVEDENFDVHLFGFDPYGNVWGHSFPNEMPDSLVAYDDGFKGYGIRAEFPLGNGSISRENKEKAVLRQLKAELEQAFENQAELAPPLKLMFQSSLKTSMNFADCFLEFLEILNHSHSWLFPENHHIPSSLASFLNNLDWSSIPIEDLRACQWCSRLFALIDSQLSNGEDLITILQQKQWPIMPSKEIQSAGTEALLILMTQQIFAAAHIKDDDVDRIDDLSPSQHARLLSAYLRAYGISLETIAPKINGDLIPNRPIILETTVVALHEVVPPEKKLEENFPRITLHARKGSQAQTISLSYDRYGSGLKWPILNGQYIVRFQPMFAEIPYRIRLRNARQINYPNSSQAYSFESDIIITDQRTGKVEEKTISMNNVHETWDGYRFYLASIAPSTEDSVKRVQIVVNYDPAKYWLTYPGAVIMTCGIVLLFLMRPYRRKDL